MNYNGSFTQSKAITPNDVSPIPFDCRAVICGGAGTLACKLPNDAGDVSLTVIAGQVIPIAPTHIRATGTTATIIVGLA